MKDITRGLDSGASDHELLIKAVRTIGLMTDNSIFARLVEEGLSKRAAEAGK